MQSFELALPEEMVFKSPIKCPKCTYKNKVKYNLLRHLKTHSDEDKTDEDKTDEEYGMDTGEMSDEDSSDMPLVGLRLTLRSKFLLWYR